MWMLDLLVISSYADGTKNQSSTMALLLEENDQLNNEYKEK